MKKSKVLKRLLLKLTTAQAKLVSWAIDPMWDYCSERDAGPEEAGYRQENIPELEGKILDLSMCNDHSIADLIYRCGDQSCQYHLPDMAESYAEPGWQNTVAMCIRVAEKIRTCWEAELDDLGDWTKLFRMCCTDYR